MRYEIWFWQSMLSPHMLGLAAALARFGHLVTFVAEQKLSVARTVQGWEVPGCRGVKIEIAASEVTAKSLARCSPSRAIHICQGIRGNGIISAAQRELRKSRSRQWIIMETVDDSDWFGWLKRIEYRRLFSQRREWFECVLANGYRTPAWLDARGVSADRIFPFAYFLSLLPTGHLPELSQTADLRRDYRFLFVGQLIERKRVDWIIKALSQVPSRQAELIVVGDGPLTAELRRLADALLPGRCTWIGRLPMTAIPTVMTQADCLVLPSRHDGWGAVVSEALLLGTPVICSDGCGAAGVVKASQVGGVFPRDDRDELSCFMDRMVQAGHQTAEERSALARWATCLSAEAGAEYLLEILRHVESSTARPFNPWSFFSRNTE